MRDNVGYLSEPQDALETLRGAIERQGVSLETLERLRELEYTNVDREVRRRLRELRRNLRRPR